MIDLADKKTWECRRQTGRYEPWVGGPPIYEPYPYHSFLVFHEGTQVELGDDSGYFCIYCGKKKPRD